jgi:hypothetical protein
MSSSIVVGLFFIFINDAKIEKIYPDKGPSLVFFWAILFTIIFLFLVGHFEYCKFIES